MAEEGSEDGEGAASRTFVTTMAAAALFCAAMFFILLL